MAYLCLKCYKVIEERAIKRARKIPYENKIGHYYVCPYTKCQGEVVWIDELMVPIITTLNQKGYKTKHSCSAHSYQENPNCYILFETYCKLQHLPKGFNQEGKMIRKVFRERGTRLFKEISNTAIELLEYAGRLPGKEGENETGQKDKQKTYETNS